MTAPYRHRRYWIDFATGGSGYVEADDSIAALEIAVKKTGRNATRARTIPYPATPIIHQDGDDPCPPFCYTPTACAGRTACPKGRACSE